MELWKNEVASISPTDSGERIRLYPILKWLSGVRITWLIFSVLLWEPIDCKRPEDRDGVFSPWCLCCCLATQSCLTLCNSMDCSLPGSSAHGILHARILEWVAVSSFRGSSRPRDWTCISGISCTTGRFFTTEPPGKPQYHHYMDLYKISKTLFQPIDFI